MIPKDLNSWLATETPTITDLQPAKERRKTGAQPGNQNRLIHGYARKRNMSPTYLVWTDMKRRCLNKSHPAFKWYGARGIKVCERWMSFTHFLSDMGDKPNGLTLDRIDNNKDYEPLNCRWATRSEQSNNQKSNHLITIGDTTLTVAQWAKKYGILPSLIHYRLSAGWEESDAVKRSVRKYAR